MTASQKNRRVLLKLSGEALAGLNATGGTEKKIGIDQKMLEKVARDIQSVHQNGIQICVVIGGGNIFRGVQAVAHHNMDRTISDQMGMLATVMNGLALQNALENTSVPCNLLSALPIPTISEGFSRRKALDYMNQGRVVISVAGSGHPYFTTDTAAALRACELNCDLLLKATKVPGVYTADPERHSDAEFLPKLTYEDVLTKKLKVMDATAIALAHENNIPIAVFSIYENNSFHNVLQGQGTFSLIS